MFKNTSEVIEAAADAAQKLREIESVFDTAFCQRFPERFANALRETPGGRAIADETQGVLRHYLSQISAGLESARHQLGEMTVELDQARRKAAGASTSTFTI